MGSLLIAAIPIPLLLRRRRANKDPVEVSDKCGYYQYPFDEEQVEHFYFQVQQQLHPRYRRLMSIISDLHRRDSHRRIRNMKPSRGRMCRCSRSLMSRNDMAL
ncbi:hypothetical protein BDV09DRAFT_173416 [Aspergillus tetrazonus]